MKSETVTCQGQHSVWGSLICRRQVREHQNRMHVQKALMQYLQLGRVG
jgi:hypothetical protein